MWVELDATAVPTTAGHAVNLDLLQTYKSLVGEALAGCTVMRCHLRLSPTTAVAAGDSFRWGLIVDHVGSVQTTAYVTGTLPNFPNPVDTPLAEWMMITREYARPGFSIPGSNNVLDYDIRAKRKIDEIQNTLVLSIATVAAGASLSVAVYSRALLALP